MGWGKPANSYPTARLGGYGYFAHGKIHNCWRHDWWDGRWFEGNYRNGEPNGYCELYWPKYDGMWLGGNYKNGKLNDGGAKGTHAWGAVKSWKKPIYNDCPNGHGKVEFRNGKVMEGHFSRKD